MTQARVVGHKGRLPWYIPAELQLFKELTWGHTLIMGRQTFRSIGRPLPGRRNIIVSRSLPATPGIEVCRSFAEALRLATGDGKKIFVIGGAEIYRQALPHAGALVISWIREDCSGDTWFPDFDLTAWTVERSEEYPQFSRVWYKNSRPHSVAGGDEEMRHG